MYRKLLEMTDTSELAGVMEALLERLDTLGELVSAAYVQQALEALSSNPENL